MKSISKLATHDAVKDKVDCSIDEGQNVHQFVELPVAVVEEVVS